MELFGHKIKFDSKKTLIINLLLTIFLASIFIFVSFPFFHKGFFPTFDDIQVVRIDVMSQELKSGQFPVRYVNEFGNGGGYFLYNFYSPLVYYVGAFLHIIGIPLVKATKFTFLFGYMLGALGAFALLRKYLSYSFSVLGASLFLTSIYLVYDSYTRGALAEFFAFCMLPLVFWSFLNLKDRLNRISLMIAGFFYGLLILTHNITSYESFLFLALIFIFPRPGRKRLLYFFGAIIFGFAISSSYSIPLFFDYRVVNLISNPSITGQYLTNFLNPLQIGGMVKIDWPFRPPLIGIPVFLLSTSFFLIEIFKKKKDMRIIYAGTSFIICVFLISDYSKFIWNAVPYLKFVQFPWRFLNIAAVESTLILSIFLSNKKIIGKLLLLFIVVFNIFVYFNYFRPSNYNFISIYKAEDPCSTSTWANEYLPIWAHKCLSKNNTIPLASGSLGIKVVDLEEKSNGRMIKFNTSGKRGEITIRRYFFPGWTVFLDNKKVQTYLDGQSGLTKINVGNGNHQIKVALVDTPVRFISNLISFFALLATLVFMLLSIKKIRYENSN